MFTKILIANRGEIACRVIRTAQRMGIQCVAVYSAADSNALHVKRADEAYFIGPARSQESYLCNDKIIKIALETNAQAIHPGYGFLSENPVFAEQCAKAGLCFIGPSPAAMKAMASKSAAKKIMAKTKVPLVPGYHEDAQDLKTLAAAAAQVGFPVLLKAVAGGGGKGMRVVTQANEFATALAAVKREALASFADDKILIEKYITQPRHVEIQIFADNHGNCIYLSERDCSIQRRHQKIIEEAPAPQLSKQLRQQMGECAVAAARAINYSGAGTVEFLVDENHDFYFMEMNTRLQVEHPVTEMIIGQDLVEWQLKVASGLELPLTQKQVKVHGHAFEARIYAEDPNNDFMPSIGTIKFLKTPSENQQVRIDTGIEQDDIISQYYDPMISKLIVWGEDRTSALQHLTKALGDYQVVGVTTNLDLLSTLSQHPAFMKAKFATDFIKKYSADLFLTKNVNSSVVVIATLYILLKQKTSTELNTMHSLDSSSPWHNVDGWRLNLPAQQRLRFIVQDNIEKTVRVSLQENDYQIYVDDELHTINGVIEQETQLVANLNGQKCHAVIYQEANSLYILLNGERHQVTLISEDTLGEHTHHADTKAHLTAPMPSRIVALLAKTGEKVPRGASLAIVEAMKMEHTIYAPDNGIVKEWYFKEGDLVDEGVELLAFEETKE